MNSTDNDEPLASRFARFYDDTLVPLRGAAAAAAAAFPLAPDASCATYWTQRARPAMQPADFLAPSCLDEAELAQALAAHWQHAGQPQLAALAAQLAALAAAARARQDSDGEVSPFVYTMF